MHNLLDINTFNRHLMGKTIDIAKARRDRRLRKVNLAQADLNRDGKISGIAETSALFRLVDRFDRDPSTRRVRLKRGGRRTRIAPLIEALAELAGVDFFRRMARDKIMLIAVTEGASHEEKALQRLGNEVVRIKNEREQNSIARGGRTYDMQDSEDRSGFVALFRLSRARADKIEEAIEMAAEKNAGDEVAQIAWVWAGAARGGKVPPRLILSGHNVSGDDFSGVGYTTLEKEPLSMLAAALPRAANQIEDLHLAGCNTGGAYKIPGDWRQMFPRVKTIWSYTGSAPGSKRGATTHMELWDLATRGDRDAIDRLVAEKTRGGEVVAVWSAKHGYQDGETEQPLSVIREKLAKLEDLYQAFFRGDRTVSSTRTGTLRDYYNYVHSLLRRTDLPGLERMRFEERRDAAIRLIYYEKSVKKHFAKRHAALVERGYKSLDLKPPNFARLSRKEALREIEKLEKAAISADSVPADARALEPHLTSGLRNLKASHIPQDWL